MEEHKDHIEDSGVVVEVSGDMVKVELERGGGCKDCHLRGMCFAKNTPAIFNLATDIPLQKGDRVQLEIAPGSRVLSSILIFLMPVVFLFAGYAIASIWLSELPSIGLGFVGMGLSFVIMRLIDKQIGGKLKIRIGAKI